ncbi:MAG: prepilin-type N-terminal cleavage/methylation domain-containing protein [Armatimonadetes bacterium]|nr:prepilin-type N-terminal cleavage/methylation domain-containing protein [Armatimonadota bacterium]
MSRGADSVGGGGCAIRGQCTRRRLALKGVHGFTLIELIGVMLLLVVLSSLAMPSFFRAHREARVRASVRRVMAALNLARGRAVSENTRARVEFDVQRGYYGVAVESEQDKGEPRFVTEVSSLGRPHALPPGITLTVLSALRDRPTEKEVVTFYDDGRADEAVIFLRDRFDNERTLSVDPLTGKVRLIDTGKQAGSGSAPPPRWRHR